MDQPSKTVHVKGCQRCGANHNYLKFKPLNNSTDDWKWWALCPILDEPLLLKETEVSDAT